MNESTHKRAEKVRQIVAEHYEEGRQDRCRLWVYRNFIKRQFGISETTFWRYLGMEPPPKEEEDDRQMKMF